MNSRSLRIAEIDTDFGRGRIGITLCPGKQGPALNGAWHERDLDVDLDAVATWNAAAVVTLIEDHEFEVLQVSGLPEGVRSRFMEWHHLPIEDVSVPDAAFDSEWPKNSAKLRALLASGANVLIHCRGGLGRAGMVAARLLVELGHAPDDAMRRVRGVRPGAIETRRQEDWVQRGARAADPAPSPETAARRDRAIGALVGLAVGDAVGTTIEFSTKPNRVVLRDMVGGGPFRLDAGQWTDDTAMALALADSLMAHPHLDATDLMNRFARWSEDGEYSCTGTCFDIGNTTAAAVRRFQRTGDPMAGSSDPRTAGNGALMRLSPVAIRHWNNVSILSEVATRQTQTTHGAAEAIEASAIFAELLSDAIAGQPLAAILNGPAAGRVKGGFLGLHRDVIHGSGYVVECLRAALWAVSRTTSFRSAVLLAAHLGEDADTTAAVAGQLAGAAYGLSGIPQPWLAKLAWRKDIEARAGKLFDASAGAAPTGKG
jgi:ADP-ribosyl-[dinitrogen reductase] hydrolase